ncbi:YopX family protein [Enterococcus faecalis]|uniref:YopX family protein n=1 Tax=Enterococcus faecalis TaxID=1351 RepID=UPI000CF1231E|nr:YopX family protein [Enterococcus faecalis]EGO2676760.1 hypothetical protein [Enterococcus faecalis]EGO2846155.1 hypothetical protein [Enterococcus faecalis]EGO5240058.1 hypothetical protein [Enterococcus faecalis]EGO7804640.1 hypothetical protein [Enterococcus faecalis]EGO8303709.1 hypothetical protein [Enterococcus faecalis]
MIPKFRAWDTYEKEMLENVTPLFDDSNSMMAIITDFQIKGSPGTSEIEIGSYDTTFNWDEFPYILMQSTGFKDKNGVEIFEGDIVQYRDGEYSYLGIVKRDCYQFFIDGIEPDDNYDFIDVSNTFDGTSSLEVIGNIWDNPELLEVAE